MSNSLLFNLPTPFLLVEKREKFFIHWHSLPSYESLISLLQILQSKKMAFEFHDIISPTISDPGAYFLYASAGKGYPTYYHMSYANHGWGGGIYRIHLNTIALKLYNLIQKEKLQALPIFTYRSHLHIDDITWAASKQMEGKIKEWHKE